MNESRQRDRMTRQSGVFDEVHATEGRTLDLGCFVMIEGSRLDRLPLSTVRCPYCENPMFDADGLPGGRVLRELPKRGDRFYALIERTPATHHVYGCPTCQQTFYAPKDREAFTR